MDTIKHLNEIAKNFKTYLIAFLKWLFLSLMLGFIGGGLGALFGKSLSLASTLRTQNGWLLFLLPLGGLLSVLIYKLCNVTDIGTNHVLCSIRSEKRLPVLLSPAIFLGTIITQLFGGSAGREGAALQLGGSISALLSRIFRLNNTTSHILTISGMSAFFSALFGTPLGACVFALEIINVGQICSAALLPAFISSVTAYCVAILFGAIPEKFHIGVVPDISISTFLRVALIGILGALLSIIFCYIMHTSHRLFKRYLKNEYLRILVGSLIIIALTLIIKTSDYNGSGIEIIHRIFKGEKISYAAFLLKIVFTAVTISAGFKGGEIVPTLFIGAAFGYSISALIGLDLAFGAAVGMAAIFCGVTNCPLATIILFTELFGTDGLIFFSLSAIISYFVSGYSSLYSGQKIVYSKLTEEEINIFPKD